MRVVYNIPRLPGKNTFLKWLLGDDGKLDSPVVEVMDPHPMFVCEKCGEILFENPYIACPKCGFMKGGEKK